MRSILSGALLCASVLVAAPQTVWAQPAHSSAKVDVAASAKTLSGAHRVPVGGPGVVRPAPVLGSSEDVGVPVRVPVPGAPGAATPAPGAATPAPGAAKPALGDSPAASSYPVEDAAEKGRCLLGNVCLAPVLNLGVINPVGLGAHARVGDYLGVGVDYQFLPAVTIQGAETSASLLSIDARLYPFKGAFFVSGGFALQHVRAAASASDFGPIPTGYRVDVEGTVDIPMIKFGLGFFGRGGLVVGIDLSLGVPLSSAEVQMSANYEGLGAGELAQVTAIERLVQQDVQDAVDSVLDVMPVLFQLNLLRLGYVF